MPEAPTHPRAFPLWAKCSLPALCMSILPLSVWAETVGKIGVDWTGNDIVVESFADPKVEGVTCHISYFDRSLIDRMSQGNWFEDPSHSAVDCSQTGPITLGDIEKGGKAETVFSERQSLVLKSIRVSRLYDEKNKALVYIAHANEVSQGSAKMAISVVPLSKP